MLVSGRVSSRIQDRSKYTPKLESSQPTFGKTQEDEVHRVELQKQVSEAAELTDPTDIGGAIWRQGWGAKEPQNP